MDLGRLERVDARAVWVNEAQHFTPWLAKAENLTLLGEAIGIELEHEATEKSVGPFSADILCKDTANGNWVLIENQLEKTDHTHLGQLITYASGLKAVTIVWIANPFTEQHRSALDWLNEITAEGFNFFGLEVELWRIGDSNIAPKFNVVSKPNDWSRDVSAAAARVADGAVSGTKQLQLEFWAHFCNYAEANGAIFNPTKPRPQHWMNMSVGRSGFNLTAIATLWSSEVDAYTDGEIRAQIEIHNRDAKRYFESLQLQQAEIEEEIGYPLIWFNDPNKVSCRITTRNPVRLDDRTDWDNQCSWLVKHLNDLYRAFAPRVKNL